MTFTELVAETRVDPNMDLLMERDAIEEQIADLEERLERIEASLLTRGYDIVSAY